MSNKAANKSSNDQASATSDLTSYVFPELGVIVQAKTIGEAEVKAKKMTENK